MGAGPSAAGTRSWPAWPEGKIPVWIPSPEALFFSVLSSLMRPPRLGRMV